MSTAEIAGKAVMLLIDNETKFFPKLIKRIYHKIIIKIISKKLVRTLLQKNILEEQFVSISSSILVC